jgi:hypothetical protein
MCCGRTRHVAAAPASSQPSAAGDIHLPGADGPDRHRACHGLVYRFAAPGTRVRVDARDAIALRRVPVLRAVAPGQ